MRLPDGLAVTRAAYDEAGGIVIEGCAANGRFTLAELRDATGTSRRYAQALLERMDADGDDPPRRRRPRAAPAGEPPRRDGLVVLALLALLEPRRRGPG